VCHSIALYGPPQQSLLHSYQQQYNPLPSYYVPTNIDILHITRTYVTGDFWHVRGALCVDLLNRVLTALKQWTQPVIMIPGNHDQVGAVLTHSCTVRTCCDSGCSDIVEAT
jgi:hypothetical protein